MLKKGFTAATVISDPQVGPAFLSLYFIVLYLPTPATGSCRSNGGFPQLATNHTEDFVGVGNGTSDGLVSYGQR